MSETQDGVKPGGKAVGGIESKTLHRQAPDEVTQPVASSEYAELREMTDMREPYRIPGEYMTGCKKYVGDDVATTPLIAFINGKSGGHMGPKLLTVLSRSLGQSQVFDLSVDRPAPVLKQLWANLQLREAEGDALAGYIRRNLRILAAGGDGTVTWLLKTIFDLGLDPAPGVAVLPLGTGNDLALSFGWGNAFKDRWITPGQLYYTLKRYSDASPRLLDAWTISLTGPGPDVFSSLPHSLATTTPGDGAGPGAVTVSGMFWNYFSVGLDAAAAYGFHSLREARPWAASTRMMNQAWYGYYSCSSGWFCGAAPLASKASLRGRGGPGGAEWRELEVPSSVRAIVVLNLQSYGGGRDIWGLAKQTGGAPAAAKPGRAVPIFSDGLVEVVGFKTGWHASAVMAQLTTKIHGVRIAQVEELEIDFSMAGRVKGEPGLTHMQLDGEPWAQTVPGSDGPPLKLVIRRGGQSNMLMNDADIQGPLKVKKLAERGAALAPSAKQ